MNPQLDTATLRFEYTSLTTPVSVYDYDMSTRTKRLLKREEVLGGFDHANYVTERRYVPAQDGAEIPLSLVYRKGAERNGQNPLLLYGYGSYGVSIDAAFSSPRLSLIRYDSDRSGSILPARRVITYLSGRSAPANQARRHES